jgi:hypothetical protein
MTISFPYRHPDDCCWSLHLHHDPAVHPPQILRQLPVRARVHEFATKWSNFIEQPSRNTHPFRRPRIRRSCRAPSPIFAAASRSISSERTRSRSTTLCRTSSRRSMRPRRAHPSRASSGRRSRRWGRSDVRPRLEVHFVRAGDRDRGSGCARRRQAVVRVTVANGDRSAIEYPPRISTSPSPEPSTDLVPSGRKRVRSTGPFSPGRIV